MIKIIDDKKRSIDLGCVGSGQAGSRLAEAFYNLGYPAVCFNTAQQDLAHINLPTQNKFLFEFGLGGAAKELTIGRDAAEANKDSINELVQDKLGECQALIFCLSLGGGSGAGSCQTMIDVLSALEKPIVVITVLPMANDDAQTKKNSLETLSLLAKDVQNKRIHNLIVVDNAKIESLYSNVSQLHFFNVSNKAIVEPIDVFNTLSAMSSSVKGLDSSEWAKILINGGGLSTFGLMNVFNYEQDTAIAEAIESNLNGNLLASGFDIKQAKYVGVLLVANPKTWENIPSANVNYAMTYINDLCHVPENIFKGIYSLEEVEENVIKIYSFFSGLGLPDPRVLELKNEITEFSSKLKLKEENRSSNLKLDLGMSDTLSDLDKLKQKMSTKKSAFNSLFPSKKK